MAMAIYLLSAFLLPFPVFSSQPFIEGENFFSVYTFFQGFHTKEFCYKICVA